jgi:uncharacterized damage-inducible protein DinB
MARHLLQDAFEHHVWATLRLIDACAGLSQEQLATMVPGTYGSIIDTMHHTVSSDAGYLWVLTGGRRPQVAESELHLDELREVMIANEKAWAALLADGPDPEAMATRHRDDGSQSHAPVGLRLAQALHHGTDHRSQICTALTSLGIEPPEIDVWAYAEKDGRISVTEPTQPPDPST